MNELYVMRQAIYEAAQQVDDVGLLDLVFRVLIDAQRQKSPPASPAQTVRIYPEMEAAA